MERNKCQRCGASPVPLKMSFFNEDMCCLSCLDNEKKHPDFEKARIAEQEEMMRKYRLGQECWFKGIGLPENNYKVVQRDTTAYLTKEALTVFTRVMNWEFDDLKVGQSIVIEDMSVLRLF